jgi:hypothetical protein
VTLDDKLKRPPTTIIVAVITLSLSLLLTSAATFVNLPQSFAQTSEGSSEIQQQQTSQGSSEELQQQTSQGSSEELQQLQLPKTSRYIDCGDDRELDPSSIVREDSNHIYYCLPNANEP